MHKNKNSIYFPYLDVVRFLAAFMIVIYHGVEAWRGWFGKEIGGKIVVQIAHNLSIGVDVFFVISGFLITYIILEEKKRNGKINIFKFMMRRSIRIWPLYFFIIAISPLIVKWVDSPSPNYFANIFFLNNFNTIKTEIWEYPFSHFWSICVEEHFYIIWPLIIAFTPTKRILSVILAVITASMFFKFYSAYTNQFPYMTLYLHTLSRVNVLAIGAIGAYYYSIKPFQIVIPRSIKYTIYLIAISCMCLENIDLWNGVLMSGLKPFIYTALIATILLDYNFNPNFIHILPTKSIIHYFGKISYGIYMYSNILLPIIIKKIMWKYNFTSPYIFFFLVVTLSIIVPIISYELFEKHLLKLNKYFRVIETDR